MQQILELLIPSLKYDMIWFLSIYYQRLTRVYLSGENTASFQQQQWLQYLSHLPRSPPCEGAHLALRNTGSAARWIVKCRLIFVVKIFHKPVHAIRTLSLSRRPFQTDVSVGVVKMLTPSEFITCARKSLCLQKKNGEGKLFLPLWFEIISRILSKCQNAQSKDLTWILDYYR